MRNLLAAVAVLAAASTPLALSAATAEAGGGCHSDRITQGSSATISLSKNCFSPAVTTVVAGTKVTWVNKDDIVHTVTGVGRTISGMKELKGGDQTSYTFEGEGVFPYSCLYHPGMAGAVVVGTQDRKLAASSETGQPLLAKKSRDGFPTVALWITGTIIAFTLGLLLASLVLRRRIESCR